MRHTGARLPYRACSMALCLALIPAPASAHVHPIMIVLAPIGIPIFAATCVVTGVAAGVEATLRPLRPSPAAPGGEGPMMEYPRGVNAALAPVNAIAAGSANLLPTIVVLDRRSLPDADGVVRRDRFVRLDGMCWSWESDCGLWRGADGWWSSELGRDAPGSPRALLTPDQQRASLLTYDQ